VRSTRFGKPNKISRILIKVILFTATPTSCVINEGAITAQEYETMKKRLNVAVASQKKNN
jgi:hypothetical protein